MRLRATIVVEYEADPADYGTDVAAEAALIDKQQFEDDFSTLVYVIENGQGYKTTVEPVITKGQKGQDREEPQDA